MPQQRKQYFIRAAICAVIAVAIGFLPHVNWPLTISLFVVFVALLVMAVVFLVKGIRTKNDAAHSSSP